MSLGDPATLDFYPPLLPQFPIPLQFPSTFLLPLPGLFREVFHTPLLLLFQFSVPFLLPLQFPGTFDAAPALDFLGDLG